MPAQNGEQESAQILGKLGKISSKYARPPDNTYTATRTAKILLSNLCERRAKYELENYVPNKQKFDSLYRSKSDYATLKILDHLKQSLCDEGFNVCVIMEAKDDFGIYDVAILQDTPSYVYHKGKEKIRIEVKASLGLPFEQLERYLWNPSPLILVRVITGHVAIIRPTEQRDFVLFSVEEMVAKASRLIDGKFFTIPGLYCSSCKDFECQYNKYRERKWTKIVTMSDEEFGEDIQSFFRNLPYVAEKTAKLVIEELKSQQKS